ncbi:fatty acid--CoA ligase [Caminibacter pacificus]|uniref:Long-chain-fatty-acid--CoA ligase n=1 Tax=Caminibacter pacificus TaxID=1424653 RepID=A0AAJ4RCW2_9BACT|nr:fatty acid--CoA ligase [Caminibacter pacificus]QCI27796.1 fatty acid--CoA ligase [Caminibacter pacificus]ROR40029.1 long-chain acyl-CoA synthetase [Caminibacter pacificus]
MKYLYNNFYEVLERNAREFRKKPAYFIDDKKVTWEEVKKKVDTFARTLELLGVKKEDKIPIYVANSLEFIIAYLATQKIGAIPVPINTFLKEDEVAFIVNDVEAELMVASSKLACNIPTIRSKTKVKKIIWEGDYKDLDENNISFSEILANYEAHESIELPKLEDLAVIIYTSGTTGKPKGAMLTYKNIFSNILGVNEIVKITNKDRFIAYLPMFHSFTMTVNLLLPMYSASPVVIIRSIMPFSNIIKQTLLKRVTIFTGVPDVYSALSRAKLPFYFHWLNKVRFFISGAAPLPGEVLNRFKAKFKKAPLLEGYGLSETSPVVAVNRPELQKPGSVGPTIPGVEVKIVNDDLVEVPVGEAGEIIVKGDNVMKGYYKREDATAETIINGWLLTGDIGKVDEDGYIYILDRKKDLIISRGVNIYPREIEEVCLKFPGVKECAVVGKKDENHGEIPIAFIEPEEDVKVDVRELRKFLKSHLANYKLPKEIYIVDNLPKNATGKVLKRVLREKLEDFINS